MDHTTPHTTLRVTQAAETPDHMFVACVLLPSGAEVWARAYLDDHGHFDPDHTQITTGVKALEQHCLEHGTRYADALGAVFKAMTIAFFDHRAAAYAQRDFGAETAPTPIPDNNNKGAQ